MTNQPKPLSAKSPSAPQISSIALYNLTRTHSILASLSATKSKWTNSDTSSFDTMHYDGNLALIHLASKLALQPYQHVLDVGSGFGATGRFLAAAYGAHVTGVELQRDNHELAQRITGMNVDADVVQRVRSVNADFLSLTPERLAVGSNDDGGGSSSSSAQFDHVISLLCINHIPESARALFLRQAARFLKPGGKLCIEDFYDKTRNEDDDSKSRLTAKELHQLRDIMACPYLPSASRFIADVQSAGFDSVEFEDVSERWMELLCARVETYKGSENPNAALLEFYEAVADVFAGGNVGGVRLTAVRR